MADYEKMYYTILNSNYEGQLSNSQIRDKFVLGLSSLFLWVVYNQIGESDTFALIGISAMFIVSQICVFMSLYTSDKALKLAVERLYDYYEMNNKTAFDLVNRWDVLTYRFGQLAVQAFMVGLIGLTVLMFLEHFI